MAEDVLGATKDGGVEVFIVKVLVLSIVICQHRTHAQHTHLESASSEPTHLEGAYLAHRHLPAAEPTPRLPLGDM